MRSGLDVKIFLWLQAAGVEQDFATPLAGAFFHPFLQSLSDRFFNEATNTLSNRFLREATGPFRIDS